MLPPSSRIPRSTYRLQLNPDFDFRQAQELLPYLKQLGVSEIYTAPIFQASAKSSHGYDVNDYNRVSRGLGGREGLDRFGAALHELGLGLLIDFVPNHMGIDGEYNRWWRHVLENGASSIYASYFDIEWRPRLDRLNDRVLVPMLGDNYGAILEKGGFSLHYDNGALVIQYGARRLPVCPESYSLILHHINLLLPSGDSRKARMHEWAESFENLPTNASDQRETRLENLKLGFAEMLLHDEPLQKLLHAALTTFNGVPGNPPSFEHLHALLERQHYRLAYWKVGAHEVNYRRFFAIDTLIGLKMEDAKVFNATHKLLAELIEKGVIDGIRLDHIDGLWNPLQYLDRLRRLIQQSKSNTLYTIVEKILAVDESLPASWPVHGTSGYEFAASLIELFLHRQDEPAWTAIYQNFTGDSATSIDETYEDKIFILNEMFPNAVSNLAGELDTIIEGDWRWRDISLHDLKTALRHLIACLQIYRTYRMPGENMAANESARISQAIEDGIRRNPCVDPVPLRFLGRVITGEYPVGLSPNYRQALERWVCKLQQVTGAIMAKSVEDTHFYRYVRLLATNEVGSHPTRFGQPVSAFHAANILRQNELPLCMLTTSTHDTKMSEDARARLFALAELPDDWCLHLAKWRKINHEAHEQVEGRFAPDAREEYLCYQALLAAWPLGQLQADDDFVQRMKAYFRKAQGEAKLNTAWTFPHMRWHEAGDHFVETVLRSSAFLESFIPFARRIAYRGMIYSLSQTLLKLTCPGIPDIYQGNEIWDFSLVDPDNRRPVDFVHRRALLDGLEKRTPADLLENWQDGAIKMHIIQSLLRCRNEFSGLFQTGQYFPLELQGSKALQAVAFSRKFNDLELLIVAPRRLGSSDDLGLGKFWADTQLLTGGVRTWKNILTGAEIQSTPAGLSLSILTADLPVAALLAI